jgi:hypothetical protein
MLFGAKQTKSPFMRQSRRTGLCLISLQNTSFAPESRDIYTLDSSICNAAVHAGKLASESGGSVTIELRPGESSYKGTTRNGIKTNDYGQYGSSFVVK